MKTDDLIAALARDAAPAIRPLPRLAASGVMMGLPLAVMAMLASVGLRADIAEMLLDPWFLLKLTLAATAAWSGYRATIAALTPGAALPTGWIALFAGAVVLAVGADLAVEGFDEAGARMLGDSGWDCLVLVPTFSALPLAVLLWRLREGAPDDPRRAGALVGLLAGGVGAFAYGLHCADDSPLFFALWYLAAIGLVAGAGALIGSRALRW